MNGMVSTSGEKTCTGALTCLLICRVQVGVFSATLPPEALEITRKFMNKPVSWLPVEVGGKAVGI